jgi:antirestriction protein
MSKIYVGTYHKYNNGSIKGDWLDLEDYASNDDFYEACRELHNDEPDPELMFQDWEDIPASFITECSLDERVWDWLELDEDDRQTVSLYLDEIDRQSTVEEALDCYDGEHDTEEDWARDFWASTGMSSQLPEYAQNYIDYESYARDCRLGGDITFVHKAGTVKAFRNR